MNNLDLYSWYIEVNILLAIFWLVWFSGNSIFQKLNVQPRPNLRLTISHILFTFFLIGPLLVRLVPDLGSGKITVGILDQPIILKEIFISDLVTTSNMELATNMISSNGSLADFFVYALFAGLLIRLLLTFKSTIKIRAQRTRFSLAPWKGAAEYFLTVPLREYNKFPLPRGPGGCFFSIR